MKNRHIWVIALALVAGAVLLTMTAGASATAIAAAASQEQQAPPPPPPPPPPPGGGGRGGIDRALVALDLTAAQAEQIKALREQAKTASQPYEEQMQKADEQIRAAVEAATFDEDAVRTLATAAAKAMTELRVVQARTDASIYKLLTDEQRATLATLRQRRPAPRRGGEPFE